MTTTIIEVREDRKRGKGVGPWTVGISGLISMALGLTLGRFIFTPLLPMMLRDGSLTLVQGGALATANYVGYFLGALLCLCIRPEPTRMVRGALVFAVFLTVAMALPGTVFLWGAWRTFAGVCVAFVMVYTTAWSQERLAELGRPKLAGLMFCGPGIGIVLTSVPAVAMTASHWPARWAWLAFSFLGAAAVLPIWRVLQPFDSEIARPPAWDISSDYPVARLDIEAWAITIIFGLAGFGYIIIATFLPVIARHAMSGSIWVDLFWPIFGVGVTVGAWLVTRVSIHRDNRRMLIALYIVQAVGVGFAAFEPGVVGLVLCSMLVGTPFLAITSLAMREARRLRGPKATKLIGLMTAAYAAGQMAGLLLATTQVARTGSFGASLTIAAAALLAGAVGCIGLLTMRPPTEPASP